VETDFIFSAVCEELGVFSGICVVFICLGCFIKMMNLGMQLRNKFYKLLVAGCGIVYIFQIFLTIGGGIKFIPLTGVTLPFISYGGSSILTTMLLFFVVQGVHIYQKEQEREYNAKQEYRKKREKKEKKF
jgi:cell division protein FtsW (lipid II flippase)